MYITGNEIKTAVRMLLNENGFIKRIFNDNHETIGYIVRKEIENSSDKSVVLFNISFNDLYKKIKNKNKSYTLSEYKFFAIQHVNKSFDVEKTDKHFNISSDEFNDNDLLNYIKDYFGCVLAYTDNSIFKDTNNENMVEYLFNFILNTKNYYKNKSIDVYFSINI